MNALLVDGSGPLALLVRATALLLGALVVSRLLRHASPLSRHALWATTTLALLALPVLQRRLPTLGVPGWERAAEPVAAAVIPASPTRAVFVESPSVATLAPAATTPRPVRASTPSVRTSTPLPWLTLLLFGWITGTVAIAASIALGVRRARRLTQRAVPVRDARLLARFDWARRLTGVTRPVALAVAPEVRTPMTGGLLRPVVLLPAAAAEWDDAMLDTVLRHELIHVRRMDAFHQIASRCSVALYWFHPLAWRAAHHGAIAREQACDAAVLALGTRPSHYARHLLALAEHGAAAPLIPAFARLHHPTLEDRVMSILDTPAPTTSSRRTVMALAGLAAWAVAVAAAGPVGAQSVPPVPTPPPAQHAPMPHPAPAAPSAPMHGQVHIAAAPTLPPSMPAHPTPTDAPPVAPLPLNARTPMPAPHGAPPAHTPSIPSPVGMHLLPPTHSAPAAPHAPGAADCELSSRTGVSARPSDGARTPVRTTTRTVGGRAICMAIRGPLPNGVSLSPLPRLPQGVIVTLAARAEEGLQQLVITGTANGNQQQWSVNGVAKPVSRDVLAWRDAMLTVMAEQNERPALRSDAISAQLVERARVDQMRAEAEIAQVQADRIASRASGQVSRQVEEVARANERAVVSARARADADVVRRGSEVAVARARIADSVAPRLVERDVMASRQRAEMAAVRARIADSVAPRVAERAAVAEARQRYEVDAARSAVEVTEARGRIAEVRARSADSVVERRARMAVERAQTDAQRAEARAALEQANEGMLFRRRAAETELSPAAKQLIEMINRVGGGR